MTAELDALLFALPLMPRPESSPFNAEGFVHQNGQAPPEYLQAMARYQGGAGQVGTAYLDLWEPADVLEANAAYQVEEFAPGFTIFGSDGGGMAYAFERTSGLIYAFPFIGMTMAEPATFRSHSFEGFLMGLATQGDQ
ncbi:hypothetical protein GCM10011375_41020 [Hymenobacter qilianensis]|uniref:Uncharacterized protein n=2 Tax=Hymenobacter qilianensis TaxID=1385715 RepID=A0ACB5PXZ9_9BACT|nr:hypothetical protein [Hymenobacter qilianensis]QNP54544.1 hypothetical protein H9L05_22615 [Hymenobacter qilianensis]GGF81878.1 hypothetical protein GCM10011375_41020 [Hymenobacter qilianensis]